MNNKLNSLLKLVSLTIFLLLIISPIKGQSILDEEIKNEDLSPNFNSPPAISNVGHFPTQPDDNDQIIINCTIVDPSGGVSKGIVYYRELGEPTFSDYVVMTEISSNLYEAEMGTFDAGLEVEYYIWANDTLGVSSVENNSGEYYSFTVTSSDIDNPLVSSIMHLPANANDADEVEFRCIATDISGIYSVELSYRVNSGAWTTENMIEIESSTYAYNATPFDYQDFVEYKINATDNSLNYNSKVYDNDGEYYNFTVLKYDTTPPVISNIQINPAEPYSGIKINITCTIIDQYNEIEFARLYYRVNEGEWLYVDFILESGDVYLAQIGPFEKNDFVEFYIYAKDSFTSNINELIDDNSGDYYSFTVLKNTLTSNLFILLPIFAIATLSVLYRKRK